MPSTVARSGGGRVRRTAAWHQPVHLDAVAVATHQGVAVQGSQRPVTPYRISQHLVQRPGQDRRLLVCQNGHRKRIGREERHVPEELHGGCIVLLQLVEGDLPGRVQQHVVGDRTLAEQLLAGGPEQLQVALRVRAVALDVPGGLLQRQGQVPQFVRHLLGQLGDPAFQQQHALQTGEQVDLDMATKPAPAGVP